MNDDEIAIRAVIRAIYETVSGAAGARDVARSATLFAEGACLQVIHSRPESEWLETLDFDGYWSSRGEFFRTNAFYEDELSTSVTVTGSTASAVSSYESRRSPGLAAFESGTNHFHFVKRMGEWKIVAMLWQGGEAAHSIHNGVSTSPDSCPAPRPTPA
jgi:hypothetical protein